MSRHKLFGDFTSVLRMRGEMIDNVIKRIETDEMFSLEYFEARAAAC